MIKNLNSIKKQLDELAKIINNFKSEAVQLKIIELVLRDTVTTEDAETGEQSPRRRRRRPGTARKKGKEEKGITGEKGQAQKPSGGKPRAKGSTRRPGPMGMIDKLIGSGFFDKKKTLSDIIVHCKEKFAYVYRNTDFSPSLGRAVRSNKLKRDKNAEGQYEYQKI